MRSVNIEKKNVVFPFLFLFLFFFIGQTNKSLAACVNWESSCYACSCTTTGCNGTQLCYGKDDTTGASCNVSQSCNTETNHVYSCDCNGQVGDTVYTQVPSCGDPIIQCIGELAPNGSGRTCHYCATAVSPTGTPPTPTPTRTSNPTSTLPPAATGTTRTLVVPRSGVNGSIVDNATYITQHLTTSYDSDLQAYLYNVRTDEPGIYYWCTYLIVDSYNQAGIPELSKKTDGAVGNMAYFWSQQYPGYIYLDYTQGNHQDILSSVFPGNAFFMESKHFGYTGDEHVALVRNVDINQDSGDGVIQTYEANNAATSLNYYVNNWNIQNPTYSGYLSFGQWQ